MPDAELRARNLLLTEATRRWTSLFSLRQSSPQSSGSLWSFTASLDPILLHCCNSWTICQKTLLPPPSPPFTHLFITSQSHHCPFCKHCLINKAAVWLHLQLMLRSHRCTCCTDAPLFCAQFSPRKKEKVFTEREEQLCASCKEVRWRLIHLKMVFYHSLNLHLTALPARTSGVSVCVCV